MTEIGVYRFLMLLAVLIVGLLAALLIYAVLPTATPEINAAPQSDDLLSVEIIRGRYLASAADCIACHTARDGEMAAGGRPMATLIGTIYAGNITPDKKTGIGTYSLNDFDRAVRHGIRPDGVTLYAIMPFPSYARMSDQDLRALYAYFMYGVTPVSAGNKESDIRWPLSLRWPLAIWRKIYFPTALVSPFNGQHYPDQQIARGAYLVQVLGQCGRCHTPRAPITLQELGTNESQPTYLAGRQLVSGPIAVNLRGNPGTGLGDWSAKQIVDFLKTGRRLNGTVATQNSGDFIGHDQQRMSDQDLDAVAAYLKTLPAFPDAKEAFAPK